MDCKQAYEGRSLLSVVSFRPPQALTATGAIWDTGGIGQGGRGDFKLYMEPTA